MAEAEAVDPRGDQPKANGHDPASANAQCTQNGGEDDAPPNGHGQESREYRFKLIDASELTLNRRGGYLVKNILPAQGLVVVWGAPKCGKSFWILDIAFHVALGREYRSRRVKQGLVVYIGCEGEFAVPARVEAFRQAKIQGPIDAEQFKLILSSLDLVRDADRLLRDVGEQLGDRMPALVIIDTLNRSLAGSESSDEDMGNYVKAADKLRERFNCAVAIIHHCGYDDSHPRGHTSLRGAADAQIAVKKDAGGLITTVVEFMKDGPEGEETASRFKVITNLDYDEDGEPISSCVLDEVALAQKPHSNGQKPLSPMAQKFYEAFNNVGAQCAQPRPESNNRPSITEDQWEAELIRRGLIDPLPADGDKKTTANARHRQTALLSKYRRDLISTNRIACSGKILWSIKEKQT
jgi:hypothetical protein